MPYEPSRDPKVHYDASKIEFSMSSGGNGLHKIIGTSKDYATCLPLIFKKSFLLSPCPIGIWDTVPPKKMAISTIEMPYEPSRDPKVHYDASKIEFSMSSGGNGLHKIIGSNGCKAMAMFLFVISSSTSSLAMSAAALLLVVIPCHNVWLLILFRASVKSWHPVEEKASLS